MYRMHYERGQMLKAKAKADAMISTPSPGLKNLGSLMKVLGF